MNPILAKAVKIIVKILAIALLTAGLVFLFTGVSCETFFEKSNVEKLTKKEASASSELQACFRIMESGKAGANVQFCKDLMDDSTIAGRMLNYFNCIKSNNSKDVQQADKLDCKKVVFPELYANRKNK